MLAQTMVAGSVAAKAVTMAALTAIQRVEKMAAYSVACWAELSVAPMAVRTNAHLAESWAAQLAANWAASSAGKLVGCLAALSADNSVA
jgi:hypothetical protein